MAEHVHRAGRAEVAASPPQRPVMLSRPSDMYEQQARAAASPAAGGRPSLSRIGPTAAGPPGFTRSSGNAARTGIARVLVEPGQALEPATRKVMESHHGTISAGYGYTPTRVRMPPRG
ncbi:hypothetical protein ACFY97_03640 [Streptomyces klenkii]|uniref:hypothetical protein n=1 Tax=Streptomyces klenkii TaxID=1420899 RepID=UPI0036EE464E